MNHFGQISPSNCLATTAASEPHLVFRNIEKHRIEVDQGKLGTESTKTYAINESNYYHNHISDHYIHNKLLRSTLLQQITSANDDNIYSIKHRREREDQRINTPTSSTIVTFKLNKHHYFIHPIGSNLDELILRDDYSSNWSNERFTIQNKLGLGFRLSLAKGSEITQILPISQNNMNNESHWLIRSKYEISLIRSVSLADHLPPEEYMLECAINRFTNRFPSHLLLLEPVKKWLLPSEIIALSSSFTSSLPSTHSHSVFTPAPNVLCMTRNKCLYQWNPDQGFIRHAWFNTSNFPSTPTVNDIDQGADIPHNSDPQTVLECSSHPMYAYLSQDKCLHHLDLRMKGAASSSSRQPMYTAPYYINAIKQDPASANQVNAILYGI